MKENKVAEAIGKVDDRFLTEAVHYQHKKNAYGGIMKWVAVAACLFLVVGSGMIFYNQPQSIVSIDVNPSIELTIGKNEKIVAAVALNEDAEKVLAGMELKKVDLDTALNAIMGSMLKNGYLNEVYNAINICVEDDDSRRAEEISKKVKAEINSIMARKDLIGDVNSQSCPVDETLQELAEKYGVSVGKLILAKRVSENLGISLETAVNLSISELWDLLEAKDVELLSKDEAVKIAAADAGIDTTKMVLNSVKVKETAGSYFYDIKFTVNENAEYKYKIDAVKGAILEFEYKRIPKEESNPPEPEKQITKTEALHLAYLDAKVDETKVKLEELVHRPKEKEYYIEFTVGLCDYIYVINASNGSIISKELIERIPVEETPQEGVSGKITSIEEALKVALAKAGVKQEELTLCDIKYHVKKEGPEYKVHFHVDKAHYEYVIHAITGECTEKKRPESPEPKPAPEQKPAPEPKPEQGQKPEPEPKPIPEPKTTPTPSAGKEKPLPPHEKEEVAKPEPKAPVGPTAKKENKEKPASPKDTKVIIEFVEKEVK